MKILMESIKILRLNISLAESDNNITTYFMISEHKEDDFHHKHGLKMHLQRVKDNMIVLDIELYAVFEIYQIKNDDLSRTLRLNCASIMYPFLREKVASIMTLGGHKPYFLPSKNFEKMYSDWLKTKDRYDMNI